MGRAHGRPLHGAPGKVHAGLTWAKHGRPPRARGVDAVVVVASGMGGRRQPAATGKQPAHGETAAAVTNTAVEVCPRCGAQLREPPCGCPSEAEAAVDTLAPAAPGPEAAPAMAIDARLTATAGPVAPPAARRARAPPAWLEAQRRSEADLPPEVLVAEKRRHAHGRSRAHKPEDAETAAAATDAASDQLGVPVKPRSSAARRKAPSGAHLEAVGAPAEAQHVAEQTQDAAAGAQVDTGSVPPVAKKARRDDRKNHHKKPSAVAGGDGAPAVETAEKTLPDATAGADASALPSEADKSGKKRSTSVRKPRQDAPVVPAIVPSVDAPQKAPRRAAAVAADKAREDAAKLRESSKRMHEGAPNNCAPPATVPAPAHALIAPQTGYVYNKVSVLRSQDSPLGVLCMDLGGLFLAAVSTRNLYTRRKPAAEAAKAEETHGGNAKDATAEVLHPPVGDAAPFLFDDVDPDVAQAWRDLQHLLPSTDAGRHPRAVVSSPAFVSCLQDFQRLLGAGMWDPNKVNGGGSARMGAHFGRLLTEPSISVAAWSAQRPDLGSRSRGRRPTHSITVTFS